MNINIHYRAYQFGFLHLQEYQHHRNLSSRPNVSIKKESGLNRYNFDLLNVKTTTFLKELWIDYKPHMHYLLHSLEHQDNCIFERVMNLLQIDLFHSVNRLPAPALKVHRSINLIPSLAAPEKEKQIKSFRHWRIVIMKNNGNSIAEWMGCLKVVKACKKPLAEVAKASFYVWRFLLYTHCTQLTTCKIYTHFSSFLNSFPWLELTHFNQMFGTERLVMGVLASLSA